MLYAILIKMHALILIETFTVGQGFSILQKIHDFGLKIDVLDCRYRIKRLYVDNSHT